jgi:hypothetical protein
MSALAFDCSIDDGSVGRPITAALTYEEHRCQLYVLMRLPPVITDSDALKTGVTGAPHQMSLPSTMSMWKQPKPLRKAFGKSSSGSASLTRRGVQRQFALARDNC